MTQGAGPPPLTTAMALYLDFDGTLIGFAPRPDEVRVPPWLPQLLEHLKTRLDGAVAVISGRPLVEIDRWLAPALLAGAGVHGAELRLRAGIPTRLHRPPGLDAVVESLRRQYAADPRVLIEDKGAAVALHFRQAPELAAKCLAAMDIAAAPAGLEVVAGNMVVEARAEGVNKGLALRSLAAQPPFAGRKPVFVGDDRTDEDGFDAVAELGGFGVKVGAGDTVATYRCENVDAVHAWLRRSLG
jgi:trehalose 6-phosphate phosphatase